MKLTDEQIRNILDDVTARLVADRRVNQYQNKQGEPGIQCRLAFLNAHIYAALAAVEVNA